MARFELAGPPDEVDALLEELFGAARLRNLRREAGDRDGEVRVRGNVKPLIPAALAADGSGPDGTC